MTHELKYKDTISKLSLEEKAALMTGENFWNTKAVEHAGVPSVMLTDGPHGLRKQGGKADNLGLNKSVPATCFPTAISLGASWDTELVERVGEAIGQEAASQDVGVVLGPGLNIIRNPLAGRAFEYYSEDPYLSGELAASLVDGIQSNGIAASPKHFAVNSQELSRMTIDEIVDERALHEIYLEGFRKVVKQSKPLVVMSSYNKINGQFANENRVTMDLLYNHWKHKGIVVTDWGGEHNRIEGLRAGNQLEMPSSGTVNTDEIIREVRSGKLSEDLLDKRVDELLDVVQKVKFGANIHKDESPRHTEHHNLAVQAAEQSIVLLKNDDTLPLNSSKSVAIIGDFAATPRYQGAGSSLVNPTKLETALENLQKTDLKIIGYAKGYHRFGKGSRRLLNQAIDLANKADVVVIFAGLDEASEAEGLDRSNMQLPSNQLKLINALAEQNTQIVVVLAGGGPVELPFEHSVNSIVHTQLSGQGGGRAIANILTGVANPSGKLTVSYPYAYEHVGSSAYFPGREATAEHRESIYVGYRHYDKIDMQVLYPFGHGLSYTSFKYSDVEVSEKQVTLTVKNTGHVAGAEVVQVYVGAQNHPTFHAVKELKAFAKVYLDPGESREVTMQFDEHAFCFYSTVEHQWLQLGGEYKVYIGSSSRDIRKTVSLQVSGDAIDEELYKELAPKIYSTGNIQQATSQEFSKLYGKELPNPLWDRQKPLNVYNSFRHLQYGNILGKAIYKLLFGVRRFLIIIGRPLDGNNLLFIIDMPFYKLERFGTSSKNMARLRKLLRWASKR
jgi:beta-glucosidase